jgi:hypothetical protein
VKVVLAFLADHAVAHDDGKVYVIGGGVDRLQVPSFPATWPSLALVVKLAFQPAEYGRPMTIELRAVSATDGAAISAPRRMSIQPTATFETVGDSVPFPFVHNMRDLSFPAEGLYRFEVLANEVEMARVELAVVGVAVATEVAETFDLLRQGFAAFRVGDGEKAESLFRSVVERQPDLGMAHNNLGFTLLVRQDADGALEEFALASKNGFGASEVMIPNLACCAYIKHAYIDAARGFATAMAGGFPASDTFLLLISLDALYPIPLHSAGDYVALMAINGAWCKLKLGDLQSASQLSAVAEAGLLTLPADSQERTRFVASLTALRDQIAKGST